MGNDSEKKIKRVKSSQEPNGSAAKAYLILYNVVQTIGWSCLLYQTIEHFLTANPTKGSLYERVSTSLIVFQNLAVLEIVHAAIRLVPSSVHVTVQQISSRVIVVCGVLMITKTPRDSIGFIFLLFAWGITEVIRYLNYALNLVNSVPYFLLWLRYTTFYVLYPLGVSGELLTLYCTYKESQSTEWQSSSFLSNASLLAYYQYFIFGVMFLYIPLFPPLYYHMIKQRRKQLGSPITKKTK